MPYKDKNIARIKAAEGAARRRKNPEYVAKQNARRKELRDKNLYGYREKWDKYYAANKERIIKATVAYQKIKPEVKQKSFEKAKALGKPIAKGIKERRELSMGYVYDLIRTEFKVDNSFIQEHPEIVEAKKLIIK